MSTDLRLIYQELLESASRLSARPEPQAARLERDCWDTLAELACGGHCEEAARALVASVTQWIEGVAA